MILQFLREGANDGLGIAVVFLFINCTSLDISNITLYIINLLRL